MPGRRQSLSPPSPPSPLPLAGQTVLVVEDYDINRIIMANQLRENGAQVREAGDGDTAVALAAEPGIDLILMDIQLPEVSGLEVTKWLKADDELHTIPVIAVTAFAMKGDEERIRQGGCEAYISKPISVPNFVETIRSYLGDA